MIYILIFRLHFATSGISSKIYISSLYRLSLNVATLEKSKSLKIGENHFVVSCLYVAFTYFPVLYYICSLIQVIF